MPNKKTVKKAQKAKKEGKAPSTQAGEFVHEEMDALKKGKSGIKNSKQAVAIGLSKARQAGVDVPKKAGHAKSKKKTSSKKAA